MRTAACWSFMHPARTAQTLEEHLGMQVVLPARVAAGMVLAHPAYAPLAGPRAQTGPPNVHSLFNPRTDTHVSIPRQDPTQPPCCVLIGARQPCCWR